MESILEFLPAFALWGSAIWFWLLTLLIIISFFIADVNEEGYWAATSFVIFLVITHFWSDFNFFSIVTWNLVFLYLGIGLVYSIIRTVLFGRKKKMEASTMEFKEPTEKNASDYGTEAAFKRETLYKLKGNVSRWWFLFPVSMINWAFTDLFRDAWNWLYAKMSTIFEKLFDLGYNAKG